MDQSKDNKRCIHNWGTQKDCLTSMLINCYGYYINLYVIIFIVSLYKNVHWDQYGEK
jgi:hypothetical protein